MFHLPSLLIPFMILLPNLLFIKWPPRNAPAEQPKGNRLLTAFEGIGRVGSFGIPIFYAIHTDRFYEIAAWIGMALFLAFYYVEWLRYFSGNQEYRLLFSSLLAIPVPMAVFPVLYFMCASAVLHSLPLFICNALFAIGHILNSLRSVEIS
ncbi:hypothetical protein [Gorillibacterium massiliense]|uniref:hypothetical protein n=1 Tax=Gorillibacterium massiliense TaxID=1280390 RepID=UPI0004B136BA|nr:hypothetical protein [Gorillibacterium massiliense]